MAVIRSLICLVLVGLLHLMTGAYGNSVILCKDDGRFPHPTDCGRYIDCIPSEEAGQFTLNEGHCHGFPYSPSLRRCVSNAEEPECHLGPTRTRRGVSFPDEDFNYLCSDDTSKLSCLNCKLKYECISGKAYIETCQTGSTCSDKMEFGGGACLPYTFTSANGSCKCEQIGVSADTYNQEYFVFCDTTSEPPKITELKCADGKVFDADKRDCVDKIPVPCASEPTVPQCGSKIETRVNPNSCSWSYTCLPNSDPISVCCEGDKYFDEVTNSCVDICDLELEDAEDETVCTKLGKVALKNDCTKYHLCLDIGDENLLETSSCPEGTYFKDTTCVSGPLPEGCTAEEFSYTQCPGFEEAKATCS